MPEEITVRAEAADSLIAVRLVDAMVTEMDQLYAQAAGPRASAPAPRRRTSRRRPARSWSSTRTASRWRAAASSATTTASPRSSACTSCPRRGGRASGGGCWRSSRTKARELGYARIRLDTGARQPHAQAMYERAGYHPIENYNGNSMASFWGEKILR